MRKGLGDGKGVSLSAPNAKRLRYRPVIQVKEFRYRLRVHMPQSKGRTVGVSLSAPNAKVSLSACHSKSKGICKPSFVIGSMVSYLAM